MSKWFSSSLWSAGVKVQFSLSLTFDGVKRLVERGRGGRVVKAPRIDFMQLLWCQDAIAVSLSLDSLSFQKPMQTEWYAALPQEPSPKKKKKKKEKTHMHTPISLFFRPGLHPLPYFSTSSILKCPLALGSLPVPCRQLRPSTKQCNVYS